MIKIYKIIGKRLTPHYSPFPPSTMYTSTFQGSIITNYKLSISIFPRLRKSN